jgi:hypothetical protein
MIETKWDTSGSEKNALDLRSLTSVAVSEIDGEAKGPLQIKSALIVTLAMLDQSPYNPSLRPCSTASQLERGREVRCC